MTRERLYIFDTTLRDGAQTQGGTPQPAGGSDGGRAGSGAGGGHRDLLWGASPRPPLGKPKHRSVPSERNVNDFPTQLREIP